MCRPREKNHDRATPCALRKISPPLRASKKRASNRTLEIDDEIREHLQQLTDRFIAHGMSREDAIAAAAAANSEISAVHHQDRHETRIHKLARKSVARHSLRLAPASPQSSFHHGRDRHARHRYRRKHRRLHTARPTRPAPAPRKRSIASRDDLGRRAELRQQQRQSRGFVSLLPGRSQIARARIGDVLLQHLGSRDHRWQHRKPQRRTRFRKLFRDPRRQTRARPRFFTPPPTIRFGRALRRSC